MAIRGYRPRHVRLAAAIFAALLALSVAFTYLTYNQSFTHFDTLTVKTPRAGLGMGIAAKVKYRGVGVGTVKSITYIGDEAQLTLAINDGQLAFIPSNATVHIAGSTIFGAKSVEFVPPDAAEAGPLSSGATVQASEVSVEPNTLFQTLTAVLRKIDPVQLNATLTALSQGLRGHGDDAGALMSGLNSLLAQLNPKMPVVAADLQQAAAASNIYADAAPNIVKLIDNTTPIAATIVDQRDNLDATLLATIGMANDGYETLEPAADDYIAGVQRVRAPLKVLSDYSPEYGCLLKAIVRGLNTFGPLVGVRKPGALLSANFILGAPAYTYPESLPIVNASGGPNCRGLPDMPIQQEGGWYHSPFLVTDNAYAPYQPDTQPQFDPPSTLQFLFNGAYAERDDY
jgi:phospholipid/cholesterol/gamma-HCH transport system substrate-binding protein